VTIRASHNSRGKEEIVASGKVRVESAVKPSKGKDMQ